MLVLLGSWFILLGIGVDWLVGVTRRGERVLMMTRLSVRVLGFLLGLLLVVRAAARVPEVLLLVVLVVPAALEAMAMVTEGTAAMVMGAMAMAGTATEMAATVTLM